MIEFGIRSKPRYAVNENADNRDWVEICDTTEPHVNGVGIPVVRVLNEPTLVNNVLIGLNYPHSLD
jgi:hypothetical protein